MTRVVADASFCGAWILPDENSLRAEKVLAEVLGEDLELWVPSLWIYELTNMLRSAHRRKRIEEEMLFEGLRLISKVHAIQFDVPKGLAVERISRLALQFNLSAYDAAYLELADRLRAPLHSADPRLSEAAAKLDLLPRDRSERPRLPTGGIE